VNSSGRLFSALQVKEIYRRRARKAKGRQAIKGGRGGDSPATRVEAYRRRSEGRATASLLAAGRCFDAGSEGRWCCVGEVAVVRGTALELPSRLTLVVVGRRWSLFLGRGGATRYPEIRRTWQREKVRRKAWQQ
jgi:hypothetical protein